MDVSYHVSQPDADAGDNALSSPYTNTEANTQTIFIRLETVATGCYATTTLDLEFCPSIISKSFVLKSNCSCKSPTPVLSHNT